MSLLKINLTGVQAVRERFHSLGAELAGRALDDTALGIEAYILQEAGRHNKTSALIRSVFKERVPGGWDVGHDERIAPHTVFVHWGTKPHTIKPRDKKALRWGGGGKFFFAKAVKHPGYKGDRWLLRAAALAPSIFEGHIAAHLATLKGA